ncbi:TauD/TfdA family dioxygenase [Variovorax paradoxus]|uniref:TauD/TfdA family dioxygenase n=1 Tax=Variovorax paradoxus TaxID=34073 RepID=UPI003ECC6958
MAFQPQQLGVVLAQAVEHAFGEYGMNGCARVFDDPRASGPIAEQMRGVAELISDVSICTHSYLHVPGAFATGTQVDTPSDFVPVPADVGAIKGALAATLLNRLLGLETVSYGSENQGHPFVNLVPHEGKGRKVRKSREGMRGHTDGVSFPFPGTRDEVVQRMASAPDWVCLVCLRNPRDVPTRVVFVAPLLQQLAPELVEALREPQFVIQAQGTFVKGMTDILGSTHIVDGGALLRGAEDFSFRFSHSNVDVASDASPQAKAALDAVEEFCANNSQSVALKPGDLLWVNNRQAVHGRGEIGDATGGQERWLLRTYGIRPGIVKPDQRYPERLFQLYP